MEAHLAKYLLVYICGEYEKKIKDIVRRKAAKSGNSDLISYVVNKTPVRRYTLSDLRSDILKQFNERYATIFHQKLDGTVAAQRYSNIITNRNLAAHGEDINMSFDEIIGTYQDAEYVLDVFSSILKP